MKNKSSIEYWINDYELSLIETSEYWNNEEEEKKKDWYVINENDNKAKEYIKNQGLEDTFHKALNILKNKGINISGNILDVAAGVGYTSAIISKYKDVNKIYCLDISKHRLEKISPVIFSQYQAITEKIIRVVGSFYDIKIPDKSIDIVIMSQAFHHALNPHDLLSEVYRIMKNDGYIIVIGEQVITRSLYLQKLLKTFCKDILLLFGMKRNKKHKSIHKRDIFNYKFRELFPSDPEKGDTHYTLSKAGDLFKRAGLSFESFKIGKQNNWIYLAQKI